MSLNTLSLAHRFIREHVREGDLCIDATAGRGRDTALLCELVGESGRVLAFDIQHEAICSTRELLSSLGYSSRAELIERSHSFMSEYAGEGEVSCIVFNFGWLPGGDHSIFTHPETSIAAIAQGLRLIREGGVMCLSIYYGGASGFEERDALLEYLSTIDDKNYTVIVSSFANRGGCPPIPVFILRAS